MKDCNKKGHFGQTPSNQARRGDETPPGWSHDDPCTYSSNYEAGSPVYNNHDMFMAPRAISWVENQIC